MKVKRALSMAGFSLYMVGVAVHLGGCSSVPKPAEPDGSARVAVNDPTRLQALQQRVSADRQLLSENNLLRAQVAALQVKLDELTLLIHEALTRPPVPAAPPVAPSIPTPQAMAAPVLPTYAHTTTASGVVIRVFHPFARTEFSPSEQVAQALRVSVRGAQLIEVQGHTDSNVVTAIDKLIAIERAEKARLWLIDNGVEPGKIRTKYFIAGHFLVENRTQQGRALNRRVEINIHHHQQPAGSRVAAST